MHAGNLTRQWLVVAVPDDLASARKSASLSAASQASDTQAATFCDSEARSMLSSVSFALRKWPGIADKSRTRWDIEVIIAG
jgi:hypothetical protein